MHADALNLREVVIFLTAAGVVVPLARRFSISPVFGFLVVGLAIGPYGIARFEDALPFLHYVVINDLEGVRPLAELGVIFLLFMIGLELSLDRLWAMRRRVFGLGGAQVVLTGSAIAAIAWLFDKDLASALVLGAALALSSTAIVMQLLAEHHRLGTATGRASFAILLCQDLAVLPILFLVAALGANEGASALLSFIMAISQAVIAIVAILILGQFIVRPVFRFVGSTASSEMFLAFVLLIMIGTALATEQVGLSMALGAFLAGLLFAETEYRHQIEVVIEPFKGLLLGLFFVSVGMGVDLAELAKEPLWLFASVVGLYLVKGPIIYMLARAFGETRSVAGETALLLGQGGEFAFVVIGMAGVLGIVPGDTAQFVLIVAGMTMIATPMLAQIARRLARRLEIYEAQHGAGDGDIPAGISGHVIIVGYGRVGQMLGSVLAEQELPHIGLDMDAELVGRFRKSGGSVFFGDASRPEMLRRLGVDQAAALVVTMDSPSAAQHVVAAARQNWPELVIYVRARDRDHATRLMVAGANHAIPETIEASLQLGEMVLKGVGVPDHAARSMIEARRQAEQAAMDEAKPASVSHNR